MNLTKEEGAMAEGKYGPGIGRCMQLLTKYGEAFGAEKLVNIASAHVFNAFPTDLLTELAEGAGEAGTFTTLHPFMSLCDPFSCNEMGISEDHFSTRKDEHEQRLKIYKRLGFFQTYTCAPMLIGNLVKKGDFVSWFGSEIQLFANSVIGAKQNREGAVVNMATAITGKSPYIGLFFDENRYGEFLVEIEDLDLDLLTTIDYSAIGYYIGGIAQDRNIVINGLNNNITLDDIKHLLTSISASAATVICHIVGVTPEAPDLGRALGNKKPKEKLRVGKEELRQTKAMYSNLPSDRVDLVILGCPHCTIQELKRMAVLLENQKVGTDQRLWVGTAHQIYDLAQTMGYSQTIEEAGGIFARTCMATIPDCPIPSDVKTVATHSFKTAHYVDRISKGRIRVVVGELEKCVHAAIQGKWEGA
jgi:predicted aconitase